VPPRVLKRLLELDGFSVDAEDDDNWALGRADVDDIVIVPKAGEVVARHVVQAVLSTARNAGRAYLFTAHDRPPSPLGEVSPPVRPLYRS
jgi:hypothetical protein